MKPKLRILSLLMAFACTAGIFTACGDGANGTGETNSSGNEVVTLKWWHMGNAPKNGDAVIEALNAKSAEDIGVKIDFIWATGDDAKVKVALSTGADDDITYTAGWFASYTTCAQKGEFLDLTKMVDTEMPELKSFIPNYVWEGVKIDGKIYAVPVYKDAAAATYWYGNKDYMIDQAGAEAEFSALGKRMATCTPLLKKLTEFKDAGNPFPHDLPAAYNVNQAGPIPYSTGYESVLADAHLSVKNGDPEHKLVLDYTAPEVLEDLRTIHEWNQAGYINQDATQTIDEYQFEVIRAGQGFNGADKAVWGLNKDYEVISKLRTGATATTSSVTGSMLALFTNTKHAKEALKYIQYINLDETYRNMLAYGIQDVNWKDRGDGTIDVLNSDWDPPAYAQATFFTLKPTYPAPATMYSEMKTQMDAPAYISDLLGFQCDIESIKNEVAACSSVFQKFQYSIQTGSVKNLDETLAQLQKELDQVGFQKVLTECQKQVDEFIAAKG